MANDDRDRFGYEGEGYIGRAGADMERDIRRYRDPRIREDAFERLTHDNDVDATDMEVSVLDGVVTLNGTVSDRDQKRRAEDILETIVGVREVQNNLRVTRDRR